jgi:hypothetical protein
VVPGGIQSEALLDDQIIQPIATHQKTPSMNTNTASLLRKLALCLSASVLTLTANATVTVNYQQDFSSYSGVVNASTVGWSYSTTYGDNGWGIIQDQGTGTGPMLFAISGWTHNMTTDFTGNETQITVQSLIWTQAGSSSAGLYSQDFSAFNGTANWAGFGPRMNFSGGNFSLTQSGLAGGASSSAVAVSGVNVGNANFSMVIDMTTGLANGYFGSPETGTLLISGFDLKGTQSLSQFQTGMRDNYNFGVYSNQGLFDNIAVTSVLVPEPSTYALVLGGIATLLLIRRRVQS